MFHENILEIKHGCYYSATVDSPSQLKNMFSNEKKNLKIGTRSLSIKYHSVPLVASTTSAINLYIHF